MASVEVREEAVRMLRIANKHMGNAIQEATEYKGGSASMVMFALNELVFSGLGMISPTKELTEEEIELRAVIRATVKSGNEGFRELADAMLNRSG